MVVSNEALVPSGSCAYGVPANMRPIHAVDELVSGVGQVALHFLLNGAALLVPLRLRIVHASQAGGLRLQRHIHVRRGNGREVLRDVLLRVGVVFAAQQRIDGRRLVGGHPRAAAERHVLLGVRHARKSIGVSLPPTMKLASTVATGASALRMITTLAPLSSVARVTLVVETTGSPCGAALSARQNRGTEEQQRQDLQSFHFQDLSFRSNIASGATLQRNIAQTQATGVAAAICAAVKSQLSQNTPDSRRGLSIGRISNAFSCLFV